MWQTVLVELLKKIGPVLVGMVTNRLSDKPSVTAEDIAEKMIDDIEDAQQHVPAENPTSEGLATEEQKLHAVFAHLDPDNKEHWAYYGKNRQRPDIDAVEFVMGNRPKIEDLRKAWKSYKAN